MKTIKCWGIPYGNKPDNFNTEEITIEMRCKTIKEFKKNCAEQGHKLTNTPYIVKK